MPWTKGKHRLTSPGQKFGTHLQPPDLFSLFPGKKGNYGRAHLQNVVSVWRSLVQIPMQRAEKEVTDCYYNLTLYPGYK